ncbi:uncharacterized protein RSE6_03750 [Rhynchosporium secalis]|uniref:Expansin-like EG45 domain-containing protein n=1 Tax=Rhynchosporium secalis TaxID=38038 RepID=A0A1E1M3K5_RHYSE|nr:uncharacterized protein RSE6_03750 [Rhynchosporium secalis]
MLFRSSTFARLAIFGLAAVAAAHTDEDDSCEADHPTTSSSVAPVHTTVSTKSSYTTYAATTLVTHVPHPTHPPKHAHEPKHDHDNKHPDAPKSTHEQKPPHAPVSTYEAKPPHASKPTTAPTSVSSTAAAATPTHPATSSHGAPTSPVNIGLGTWYGESCGEMPCWQGGACAFVDYVLPPSIMGSTCISEQIWNNGYHCGGCVEISYKGGAKKIAMITNKTGGDGLHLDMSPDMFSLVADKSLGGINIEWAHVPCPISSPIIIRIHNGGSRYWFAATVLNATLRTSSLDVSTDSGATWKPTKRNINNFFELGAGGTGTATAWVRVTSETGSQVIVKDVQLKSGASTSGTSNYA